ncbi:MAG: class I SAM-dependent methyltransferase, partial [Actinomycetota bacterium]|nr:class I SAM-dependent methyltransferase [Actinomycetota bacterium]
ARGCAVTAVDTSAGMVARLAADHQDMLVLQQDAAALRFPDGSFDLVTAGFLVQILDEPDAALAEFHRVLAPGGVVALSLERPTVGRLGWLHDLSREFSGCVVDAPLLPEHLDDLLAAVGFVRPRRSLVTAVKHLRDPAALWDWIALQGVPEALDTLPMGEAVEEQLTERVLREASLCSRRRGAGAAIGRVRHETPRDCRTPSRNRGGATTRRPMTGRRRRRAPRCVPTARPCRG